MNKYRTMSKQFKVVFWFTFVGFLQRGISIITTPIFTRVLLTDDYGMFSVFNAYYMVIVIVATLSLHMGISNNDFVKKLDSNEKIVSVFQRLSLVALSVCLVFATIFHNQLSAVMRLLVLVAVNVIISGAFFYINNYRKDHTFYDKVLWRYAMIFKEATV